MPQQNDPQAELNSMLGQYSSGCLGEVVRLIVTTPFKIVRDMVRYRGSLFIWPIPLLLIIILAVNGQYGAMIVIIILAVLITYIARGFSGVAKWSQTRPKFGKSEIERELDKLANVASHGDMTQESYADWRSSIMLAFSPGSIDQVNDMRARNIINDREYMDLNERLRRGY